MAFRFSLQPVLRLRQSYERREELRLATIVAYLSQLRNELEGVLRERFAASENLAARLQAGMISSEYQFELAGLARLWERQHHIVQQIAQAERDRALQEQSYREAQKRRKILENLRARRLAAFRQVQARREQQQLDDVFAVRLLLSTLRE